MNDTFIFRTNIIPGVAYALLGDKGMAIVSHVLNNFPCESYSNMRVVPYFLSMWAVFTKKDPVPRFVDSYAEGHYIFKAQQLCAKHLATSANLIWYSIPDSPRTVMITMWSTCSDPLWLTVRQQLVKAETSYFLTLVSPTMRSTSLNNSFRVPRTRKANYYLP